MNTIRLQPIVLPKDIVLTCPYCRNVVSRGSVIVISAENGLITGLLPETDAYCCGNHADGPRLFMDLDKAARAVSRLSVSMDNKTIELLPAEPYLIEVLESVGSSLSEAQRLFEQTTQTEKVARN